MKQTCPAVLSVLTVLICTIPSSASGEDGDCDAGDRDRLLFLERHLGDNASYARWWWRSWNTVYVLGIGVGGAQAAVESNDRGKRANAIATATKSAIGLTRGLWSPPTAKRGSEEQGPLVDAVSCRERVALAEKSLRASAKEAEDERWSWVPHTVNLALNAAAAVIVAETYDYAPAYWSGLLGLAMGELRLWTFPWQARDDLEKYERRFADEAEPETTWSIQPWSTGARLVVRF